MKVNGSEKSTSFFAYETVQKDEKDKKSTTSIFAGDLLKGNQTKSLLEQKREKARKEAMQVVRTQFENDAKIDDDIKSREQKIADLRAEADSYNKSVNEIKKIRDGLQEQFGLSDEEAAEQEKTIALVNKARRAQKNGGLGQLSMDELERIAGMGPLSEYQEAALACDENIDYYNGLKDEALKDILQESSIVQETKNAGVKNQGMIKSQKCAEDMLQQASQAIIGDLLEEAKEHMDEEMEELREEAKKAAEKKKEEEALLHRGEEEDNVPEEMYDVQEARNEQKQIEAELQEIIEKNKLLEEDLKGIAVNQTV